MLGPCNLATPALETVAEYDASGVRQNSYAVAGGGVVARQSGGALFWRQVNPVTGDELETDSQRAVAAKAVIDPVGVALGNANPFEEPAGGGNEEGPTQAQMNQRYAQLLPPSMGGAQRCNIGGIQVGCRFIDPLLTTGAGVIVPSYTDMTARVVRYGGRSVLAIFRVTDDGYQGLMPLNASYKGNGRFSLIGAPNRAGLRGGGHQLETDFSALNGTGNNENFLARSPGALFLIIGGPQNPSTLIHELGHSQQQQPKKVKCKQDPNGGDIPEIEDYLERAGLLNTANPSASLIVPSSIQVSKEGVRYSISNVALFNAALSSSRYAIDLNNGFPWNGEHDDQVGGKGVDNRFRTGTKPDKLGRKSLQVVVGPPNASGRATGYADLDCSNPVQSFGSAIRHIFGR